MKAITILLLFLSTIGFSQNTDFHIDQKEFNTEFIRLVDSARTAIHGTRKVTYMNPQWKSSAKYRKSRKAIQWITEEYEFSTNIDSNASLACEHHNKFLYYLVIGEPYNPAINGHVEDSIISGYKYKGSDTLLKHSQDRCDYYCGKGNFDTEGECVWGGYTDHSLYRNMTSIELAREAFKMFMESPKGHGDILTAENYTDCGINLFIDPEFKTFKITFVTGYTKKAKN